MQEWQQKVHFSVAVSVRNNDFPCVSRALHVQWFKNVVRAGPSLQTTDWQSGEFIKIQSNVFVAARVFNLIHDITAMVFSAKPASSVKNVSFSALRVFRESWPICFIFDNIFKLYNYFNAGFVYSYMTYRPSMELVLNIKIKLYIAEWNTNRK